MLPWMNPGLCGESGLTRPLHSAAARGSLSRPAPSSRGCRPSCPGAFLWPLGCGLCLAPGRSVPVAPFPAPPRAHSQWAPSLWPRCRLSALTSACTADRAQPRSGSPFPLGCFALAGLAPLQPNAWPVSAARETTAEGEARQLPQGCWGQGGRAEAAMVRARVEASAADTQGLAAAAPHASRSCAWLSTEQTVDP